MEVDKKRIKDFEDEYKKILFDKIEALSSNQSKIISQIRESGKIINLECDLSNFGITLNNKIIEMQHEFEDAGISIYSQWYPNHNFVASSFVGMAIILDLIDYAAEGTQKIADYSNALEEIIKKRNEQVKSLEKANPVKRLFAKVRNFFVPARQDETSYTKEAADLIKSHLLEYEEADQKIWEYNLMDNVVSSIVKYIKGNGYSADNVQGLLEENVIPDLQKLGLSDLVPQLQQVLKEEYKEDRIETEIYQIDDEEQDR